jgi:hypothetical protein
MSLAAGSVALRLLGPTLEEAAKAASNLGERIAAWSFGEKFTNLNFFIKNFILIF